MNNNQNKIYLFEQMPIPKAIITLGIPTVLSSLVMVIYSLADTLFVGMLNDATQNAAVAFAAPVLLAFNAVNNLFGIGASSLMSRAMGLKDYHLVKQSSSTGFYFSIVCAVLISLLCFTLNTPLMHLLGVNAQSFDYTYHYLFWVVILGAIPSILNVVMAYLVRAEGASLHASLGTMLGAILNIILDPIFILPWGLNMGAAGAGCATFISNVVACLYFFILLYKKRGQTYVSIHPKDFTLKGRVVKQIFAVGIPASIQNLLNVTGMTILNNLTASYGTEAVAAMGIVQKVNMVPLQIMMGMSNGIMPLISYNYSALNVQRMKDTLHTTIRISLIGMLICFALLFINSKVIVEAFIQDPNVIKHGVTLLRCFSVGLPFMTLDWIGVGVYQAIGDGKKSLAFAILRKIVLEIPLLFIFNQLWPLYGLACSQPFGEAVLSILAFFTLRHIFIRLEANQ